MQGDSLKTVERTLALLNLFAGRPEWSWSLAELAEASGIHKTTVLRMLSTLERHGYLVREAESRRYRLGPAALALGGAAAGMRIRQVAYPVLRRLTEETGETAMLHVISGTQSVCIDKVESPQPIRVTYDIGRQGPLYAGSSGKVLLAFLEPAELDRLLPRLKLRRYTELTITDRGALRRELEQIRERGYATSYGELDPGVYAIGAPVWGSLGRLEAGVSLVGPGVRWTEAHWQHYVSATLKAAREVSLRLGYRPDGETARSRTVG